MIIIIFCVFFFSNTILPTFTYWKIKIPIYSLYKKEAFKSTRNKRTFFVLFVFCFYTQKVNKRGEKKRRRVRKVEGRQKGRFTAALSVCASTD